MAPPHQRHHRQSLLSGNDCPELNILDHRQLAQGVFIGQGLDALYDAQQSHETAALPAAAGDAGGCRLKLARQIDALLKRLQNSLGRDRSQRSLACSRRGFGLRHGVVQLQLLPGCELENLAVGHQQLGASPCGGTQGLALLKAASRLQQALPTVTSNDENVSAETYDFRNPGHDSSSCCLSLEAIGPIRFCPLDLSTKLTSFCPRTTI